MRALRLAEALFLGLGLTLAVGFIASTVSAVPGSPTLDPPRNSNAAPPTTTISISYDEPISASTVTSHTFAVHAMQTGLLDGTFDVDGGMISLSPTNAFFPGELVQATATTGTLSITGTAPLSPTVWQFRTAVGGGSGVFTASGADLGQGIWRAALGDMDADGDLDVVVGVQDHIARDAAYLNDGDGTFSTVNIFGPSGDLTHALALGDLDGDGDLDVVVGNKWAQDVIYLNDGDGMFPISSTFGMGYQSRTIDLALGDVDGDGDLDAVVGIESSYRQNEVYLNDGAGNFPISHTFGTGSDHTFGVALGDVDGDGDLDVVVGNYGVPNAVYLNDGDGIFPTKNTLGTGSNTWKSVALGDVDGDGDLDVAVSSSDEPNVVYLNDGDGTFPISNTFGLGPNGFLHNLALGDVDGDGDLDVVSPRDAVHLNDGDGTFPTKNTFDAMRSTWAVALGDMDGDGDLDIVSASDDYGTVYLNQNADLEIVKEVTPAIGAPGEAITLTLTFSNVGSVAATHIVITDPVSAFWSVTSVLSYGVAITDTGHAQPFVWAVQDLAPGEGGILTVTGQLTTPLADGLYTNTATISADDDANATSNTSRASILVNVNDPPFFTSAPVTTATQDTPYSYTVATDDPDLVWGDTLTLTAPTLPGWLAFNDYGDGTALLSGTPASADVGEHAIVLQVVDSGGLTATQSFTLTVMGQPEYWVYLPLVVQNGP